MRRGETATVFETCSDMGDLFKWFLKFLDQLEAKVRTLTAVWGDPCVLTATGQVLPLLDEGDACTLP